MRGQKALQHGVQEGDEGLLLRALRQFPVDERTEGSQGAGAQRNRQGG